MAIKKWIFASLLFVALDAENIEWGQYKKNVLMRQYEVSKMGWCSTEKAAKIMNLVHKTEAQICVEIGVFGGASIYPFASALKFAKQGVIYAIDPWKVEDCLVGYDVEDPNYQWWSKLDLEGVYRYFLEMLSSYQLKDYCNVLRMKSEEALDTFADASIDILHIDGNHTEGVSLRDVLMYFCKVKKGGYIYFDDANWPSTASAVAYLHEHCEWIPEDSIGNECLLFKKL